MRDSIVKGLKLKGAFGTKLVLPTFTNSRNLGRKIEVVFICFF